MDEQIIQPFSVTKLELIPPSFSRLCSDEIFHILLFLGRAEVANWFRVSTFWNEQCRLLPLSIVLSFGNTEKLHSFLQCPRHLNVTALKLLDITDCTTDRENCKQLAACRHLKNTKTLELCNNPKIDSEQLETLLTSPHLTQLTDLDISNCCIRDAVMTRITENHSTIKRLNLSYNGMCSVEPITSSPFMSNLTYLNIYANKYCNTSAQLIASSPHMQNLTELRLGGVKRKHRRGGSSATRFATLFMRATISNLGVQSIADSIYLKNLKCLSMTNGRVTDEGAELLAKSEGLESLMILNLSFNPITTVGQEMLKNSNFVHLTDLRLTIKH